MLVLLSGNGMTRYVLRFLIVRIWLENSWLVYESDLSFRHNVSEKVSLHCRRLGRKRESSTVLIDTVKPLSAQRDLIFFALHLMAFSKYSV